ncbi:MAG: GspE/PulE family protein [Patescibacteria group bacterium]
MSKVVKKKEGEEKPKEEVKNDSPKEGKVEAKNVAEKKNVENKGVYFVSVTKSLKDFRGLVNKVIKLEHDQIPIIDLVDNIVGDASVSRASDIHIDPAEKKVVIRFRVDGVLHDIYELPKEIQSEVITRIKVLSGLRTDEHRAAQDGRFRLNIEGLNVDVRVSIAPTYYGENGVLRLLSEKGEAYTLEAMGFRGRDLEIVTRNMHKPYGMILATGPTGSGKTTTLYTILKMLSTKEVAIITIEDPVEYAIEGIEQIQVNPRTGLTFADGLRSILRQDPNIVMVGEIRDQEAAGIAVNAALTGHLLLSTIHTNDAPTTLPRLLDMGIEPFLIASTVNIAIGQRLVRKLCDKCKTKKDISPEELKSLARAIPEKLLAGHKTFYYGAGCDNCDKSGYKGRIGIYEVLEMDDELRSALLRNADSSEIKRIAMKNGMTTMTEDGFLKALDGLTTIEEILRVTHE